jgi:signal peptidase I
MGNCWQKSTIILVAIGMMTARPGWSDVPSTSEPIYSESFCLKIFEEVVEKARSSTWKISDRDRHILTQCRSKFPPDANSQTALPTAAECIYVVKTLVQGGLSKVKEIELPEEQAHAIARCDEVIKYYALTSENMLPTLKLNERVVVDKTIYQTQAPQRGDIIVFNPSNNLQSEQPQQPLTQRAIGLPGEKVTIKKGKVYIDGKPIREDYITQPAADLSASIVIPAHSYFMLGDNRNNPTDGGGGNLVSRAAIVGKVIWNFSSK